MKIDIPKRRQVMERSQRLGYCICDPRRPCPCDVFRDHGICPCAGERPDPIDLSQLKLTRMVRNAGCASKIAPTDLEAVLSHLPEVKDPAVISGLAAADDAGIYRIAPDVCLVQTVDVFTPCVDDPHRFGQICAANCLSDIYAMGGVPRTALSIVGFPAETLSSEVMYHLLTGAMQTLAEAGVALIGGHSIKDDEIKLGFAITGLIDPTVAAALDTPAVGDVLVLTKPLGTGVLQFAQQINQGHPAGLAAAETAMATLNRAAAQAMSAAGASACTDITGFGLFGHLIRLLRKARLTARVYADALPAFPGALQTLAAGVIPGAIERNREFVGSDLEAEADVQPDRLALGFDAQTSGGLLIAVPAERLPQLEHELALRRAAGFVFGEIVGPSSGRIQVVRNRPADSNAPAIAPAPAESPGSQPAPPAPDTRAARPATNPPDPAPPGPPPAHEPGCCAEFFGAPAASHGSAPESQQAFGALMRSTQAAGALDEKTKELILFSLVLHSRCAPCFDAHIQRAQQLGLSRAQLDEAAWCAVAMGGAPVRLFYQAALARWTARDPGTQAAPP